MTPDSLDVDKSFRLTPAVRPNVCNHYLCSTQVSQSGLSWKAPSRPSSSKPLLWAGTPSSRPGCSKPDPAWMPTNTPNPNHREHQKNKQIFPSVLLRSQLQKDLSEITQTKLKSKRSPNQDSKLSQNSQSWAKNYTGLNKTLITKLQNFSELFLSLFSLFIHWTELYHNWQALHPLHIIKKSSSASLLVSNSIISGFCC